MVCACVRACVRVCVWVWLGRCVGGWVGRCGGGGARSPPTCPCGRACVRACIYVLMCVGGGEAALHNKLKNLLALCYLRCVQTCTANVNWTKQSWTLFSTMHVRPRPKTLTQSRTHAYKCKDMRTRAHARTCTQPADLSKRLSKRGRGDACRGENGRLGVRS